MYGLESIDSASLEGDTYYGSWNLPVTLIDQLWTKYNSLQSFSNAIPNVLPLGRLGYCYNPCLHQPVAKSCLNKNESIKGC